MAKIAVVKEVVAVEMKQEMEVAQRIITMLDAIVAKKKGHIANFCTEQALIPKDDNKSSKPIGAITLDVITPCQIGDLKKVDLLDSGATDHVHNS